MTRMARPLVIILLTAAFLAYSTRINAQYRSNQFDPLNPMGLPTDMRFCRPSTDFRASCQLPLMLPMLIGGVMTPQHRMPYWPQRGVYLGDSLTVGPSVTLAVNGVSGLPVGFAAPDPAQSMIIFSCDPGVVVRSVRLPLRLEAAQEYARSLGKTALAERMQADAALGFIEWLMFSGRVPGCFDDVLSLVGATREYVLDLVKEPIPHTLLALWEQWLREGGRP